MNKATLVKYVAEKAGMTQKDAAAAVSATFEVIAENMGEGIAIPGFGNFGVKMHGPRQGLNPRTKEKVDIPASLSVFFKASKALKDKWKNGTIEY